MCNGGGKAKGGHEEKKILEKEKRNIITKRKEPETKEGDD